jgi:cytochrome c oxidase subunit II
MTVVRKREAFYVGLRLPRRARTIGAWAITASAVLALSACSDATKGEWHRAAMPEGASDKSGGIIEFWQWTWVAALCVGVLVWGLIFYAIFRFRRRSEDEIPVQTRYNLPMEILYTVAPVVVVLVFFHFVIDNQDKIDKHAPADHVVQVVGQQWSWTFNYYKDDALGGQKTVYEAGTPAEPPTLYLPVGESVQFILNSPDVIHSFWVPAFSYKLDVIPGRQNTFTMTPIRQGTFAGKCAELCGTYHSRMLFNVKVVSHQVFVQELQKLQQEGNVGLALGGSNARTQAGLNTNSTGKAGQ